MQSVSTRKTHHMGIIIIHVNILELIMVAIRRTCTEASCTTVRGEREALVSGMQSLHNIRARALSRYSTCTRAWIQCLRVLSKCEYSSDVKFALQ